MEEGLLHVKNGREKASLLVVKGRSEAMLGGNQQTHKAEETMTAALNEFPNFVAAHYWSACLFYEPQGRWV